MEKGNTKTIIPSEVPDSVLEKIYDLCKRVCHHLNIENFARIDLFWNEKTNAICINEINTLPGFTPYSMFPLLLIDSGFTYNGIIDQLIQNAVSKPQITKFT